MLLLAGGFLLALGLFAGVVLLLAPLGLTGGDPGPVLWVMFPLLCLTGFALIAVQAGTSQVRAISLGASAFLLAMALASVGAIVLSAASVIAPLGDTASLWFVLAVSAVLGSFGAASFGRQPSQA